MPADLKQVAEAASAALEAWAAAKLMNSRAAEQQGPHCFQSATEATMKSLLHSRQQSGKAAVQQMGELVLSWQCLSLCISALPQTRHFSSAVQSLSASRFPA